ncbi:MAG: hypothetical protein M1831_003736 [Alyxoria varia]|nr:MAG: hypothetical protein M1831_003736 [Alyxoria varia]
MGEKIARLMSNVFALSLVLSETQAVIAPWDLLTAIAAVAYLPRFATHNNLTHRRAYSHNKPIMANRRSDSHVQSVRGGQHPPLHRTNHAHRETGFPYNVGRFSRSTGNFEFPQRSLESNPPTSSPVYGQQSQDMSTILPPRQNNFVRSEVNSPAPPANVSPHADNWNNTLGSNRTFLPSRNPARHSMNDFSQLSNNWDYMNSPYLPPTSAGVDPFAFQMQQHLGGIQSLNAYNNHSHNPSEQDLQRSSFMSIEQPGLSHSPSASASEAGESVANFGDHPYSNNTIPQYNQKESDQFLPVQEYESPNMDFYSQAHSATSTPFAYSVSDSGLAGPADFLNGPGPATSQEFKQQSSSPINFSIDPPSQDYSTADIPSTTSEHLPSGQPMQSTMNQSGMAMPAGQGYGSQPEYRVSPAPPAAAGNSPYA